MTRKLILPILSMLLLLAFACDPDNTNTTTDNKLINKQYDIDSLNDVGQKIKEVFYALPSPIEMASIIKDNEVEFSTSILNTTDKAESYLSTEAMAVNLGVYGADLSFTSFFDENQQTLEYFTVVKKLADNLNILEALNDSTMQEIETNIEDNEVLVKIISESFFKSDAYLKESQKENIATLIVLGAWIESLYLSIEMTGISVENMDLAQRIIDQRLVLENVLLLLESIEDPKVKEYSSDFVNLKTSFESMITIEKKEVYDEYADTMRTKTITKYDISQEKYTKLYDNVLKIRNMYISLD